MCSDCDGITRRSFLAAVTVAVAGVAVGSEVVGQQRKAVTALDDPNVVHSAVTFKNGQDTIQGYLARPRARGRRHAVVINHGDSGISEDIRNAAAQVAQAGYVGLVVDWASRPGDPFPPRQEDRAAWFDRIRTDAFQRQWMNDTQAGIDYLKTRPFVRRGKVGMVGFCGGGYINLRFATISSDVKAVVALYAPPMYTPDRNSPTDPKPDLIDFAGRIRVPIQCHYGTADPYIPLEQVRRLEHVIRNHKLRAELFFYEGAGHAFCDYTNPNSYKPEAAALAKSRMIEFLRRHVT
jgi:carboxymethylenebutenolidase